MIQFYKWFIQLLVLTFSGIYVSGQPNYVTQIGLPFFVQTSATNGIVFSKKNAEVKKNGLIPFSHLKAAVGLIKLDSRLYSINGSTVSFADANVVVFDNAYSNVVDGDDAIKLANSGENYGILRDNKILVIEARQIITNKDTLFFRVWNLQQQNYKFEFVPNDLNTPGLSAVLQDNYLNINTTLDLSNTNTINFTVNAAAGSSATNRFRIVFEQLTPLPVSFLNIAANRIGNNIKVDWQVAAEREIINYEVQRSTDGLNFIAVGIVSANRNSATLNYNWMDLNAVSGTFFYRIKSNGISGEATYTNIVKVAAGKQQPGFSISPNPVENGIINLQMIHQPSGNYRLRLINLSGQTVINKSFNHSAGNGLQILQLPELLAAGNYTVEIIAADNTKTNLAIYLAKH